MDKRNWPVSITLMGLLTLALTGCALLELFRRTEQKKTTVAPAPTGTSEGDNSPVYVTTLTFSQIGGAAGLGVLSMLWLFVRERYKASALRRVMKVTEIKRPDGSAEDVVSELRRYNDQTEKVIQAMARKLGRRPHGEG